MHYRNKARVEAARRRCIKAAGALRSAKNGARASANYYDRGIGRTVLGTAELDRLAMEAARDLLRVEAEERVEDYQPY